MSRLRLIVISILLNLLMPFLANAEYCNIIGKRCIDDKQTRVINGVEVKKPCWEYEYFKECHKDEYVDYCRGVKNVSGCEQISSNCIKSEEDGFCSEKLEQYQCGSLLNKGDEVKLLDTEYTVTKDELDTKECTAHEISNDCEEIENKCIEGAETRNINGKDVYKECWKYQKQYSCFNGSLISDCKELKNKCTLVKTTCLSKNNNGSCKHNENVYECLNITGKIPKSNNCKSAKYCIDGDCEEVKYARNQNIGAAISGLSLLSSIKKDLSQEECAKGAASCKIFRGNNSSCKINTLSARNCCRDKGWLKDAGLLECAEDEKLLAVRKERGLCHFVGSYKSKKIFGKSYEKKQSYCCFDSKLARIVQEQGRQQLGIGWGEPKNPNCAPLSIEDLQRIDFNRVDLREVYGDLLSKLNISKHNKIKQDTTNSVDLKLKGHVNQRIDQPLKDDQPQDYKDEIARRFRGHYGN